MEIAAVADVRTSKRNSHEGESGGFGFVKEPVFVRHHADPILVAMYRCRGPFWRPDSTWGAGRCRLHRIQVRCQFRVYTRNRL